MLAPFPEKTIHFDGVISSSCKFYQLLQGHQIRVDTRNTAIVSGGYIGSLFHHAACCGLCRGAFACACLFEPTLRRFYLFEYISLSAPQ
jgi:hypothetical protein